MRPGECVWSSSTLKVLGTLLEEGGFATADELCLRSGLSRSTVDRSLEVLVRQGAVAAGRHRFGRPRILLLTEAGVRAARHLRSIAVLLNTPTAGHGSIPEELLVTATTRRRNP